MIAGVDHTCEITDLELIKYEFPFLEWGVLYSKNAGRLRYPDGVWLHEFHSSVTGKLSAHLCGGYPREILEDGNFDILDQLPVKYDVIQLNYNFEARKGKWRIPNIIKLFRDTAVHKVPRDIILQLNKANKEMVRKFHKWNVVRVLVDASGGRGIPITEIPDINWTSYTGIAGGINPDNIEGVAELVTKHESANDAWLDLESGVRTDNHLDLVKVRQLLERVEKYVV